jgi:DNA-binding NarL/FixJ family response regulator
MEPRGTIGPQGQIEPKIVLNLDLRDTAVQATERHPQRRPPPYVAMSIVSNSRLLSEGLPRLLSPHLQPDLIATYQGKFQVQAPLPNPKGHIVLLDIGIGRAEAVAWTRYWRGLMPPACVLVMELNNDTALILDCIEAGASGYTFQGASAGEVARAIIDLCNGVARCSPEITAELYARLAALRTTVTELTVSPLTARESEVLHYIAAGYTNSEIADQLVIELRTVKQHVHHILGKLEVRSRGDAARLATEKGWLD